MTTRPANPARSLDSVVVLGGSIGGLLAAAAAAPHTRRVVVVERDPLPEHPGTRPGTPQAPHVHGLLASGRQAMEELLPGLTDDLAAQGALVGDIGTNARWYIGGARLANSTVGALGLLVSRPLLEAYLRARVRDLPNVTVLDRTDARALGTDPTGAVTGVRVRGLDDPTADEGVLRADLVVDATGRPGRASRWFDEHGWPSPPEERVVVGIRYATVHVRYHEGDLDGARSVISAATPAVPRSAAALRQEDGTWTVVVAGYLEQAPPADPEGIRAFARTLVAPEIAQLLGRELLHEPLPYRFPHSVRRRIEQVRLPAGYAVLGDAICSFNPVFGQGMSVAAMQAVALREALGAGHAGLAAAVDAYHRRAAERVDRAWTLLVGNDLQIPGVVGERPAGPAGLGAYVRRLQRVAAVDPVVGRALLRVTALIDPPPALLRPAVALRVLTGGRRGGGTAADRTAPPRPLSMPVG